MVPLVVSTIGVCTITSLKSANRVLCDKRFLNFWEAVYFIYLFIIPAYGVKMFLPLKCTNLTAVVDIHSATSRSTSFLMVYLCSLEEQKKL